MEARPLRVIPVHEHLRPRLMDLYESDCIFDKFEVSSSTCSLAAGAPGSATGSAAASSSGGGGSARSDSDPGGAALGGSGGGGGGGELAGLSVITGSYNNTLRVYDMGADSETTIELSKTRPRPPTSRGIPALHGGGAGGDVAMDGSWGSDGGGGGGGGGGGFFGYGGGIMGGAGGGGAVDFTKKLLHCSFHPTEPIIAVAGAANLFIYAGGL